MFQLHTQLSLIPVGCPTRFISSESSPSFPVSSFPPITTIATPELLASATASSMFSRDISARLHPYFIEDFCVISNIVPNTVKHCDKMTCFRCGIGSTSISTSAFCPMTAILLSLFLSRRSILPLFFSRVIAFLATSSAS